MKLLQSATKVYYKVWQVLQSATKSLLQSVTGITKCDSYYKVWQKFYYKVRQVLQSVTGITKCDRVYYKVRQVLQCVTVITKWDVTRIHVFVFQTPFTFSLNYFTFFSSSMLMKFDTYCLQFVKMWTFARKSLNLFPFLSFISFISCMFS